MPGRNLRDARSKLKHPLIYPASISSLDRRPVIAAHWSAMGQLHCPAPLIPPPPSLRSSHLSHTLMPLFVLPCLLCQSHALPPLLPPQRRLFIAVLNRLQWPMEPSASLARISFSSCRSDYWGHSPRDRPLYYPLSGVPSLPYSSAMEPSASLARISSSSCCLSGSSMRP